MVEQQKSSFKTWEELSLEELREISSNTRNLCRGLGFEWWVNVLKTQQARRLSQMYMPVKPEGVYEQEFQKGEMAGMEFAIKTWALMIEEVDNAIKAKEDDKAEGRTEK